MCSDWNGSVHSCPTSLWESSALPFHRIPEILLPHEVSLSPNIILSPRYFRGKRKRRGSEEKSRFASRKSRGRRNSTGPSNRPSYRARPVRRRSASGKNNVSRACFSGPRRPARLTHPSSSHLFICSVIIPVCSLSPEAFTQGQLCVRGPAKDPEGRAPPPRSLDASRGDFLHYKKKTWHFLSYQ